MLSTAARSCRKVVGVSARGVSTFSSPFSIDSYPDVPLTEFILEVRDFTRHCNRGWVDKAVWCTALVILQRSHEFGEKDAFVDGPTGRSIKYNELAHRIGGAAEVCALQIVLVGVE